MIYIVIPVFNRKNFTKMCLLSLRKQSYENYQIIVVDDGSTDGTREMIMNEFQEVIRVEGNGNLWWAGATNKGIQYIIDKCQINDNDFFLTLNNDLEVDSNYLRNLLNIYSQNIPCLVGSVCIDIDNKNKIEDMGCIWNKYTAKYKLLKDIYGNNYKHLLSENKKWFTSDMLSGRGVLIPFQVIKKIGLFDDKLFPQYASDNDFSLRAKKKGFKLLVSLESPVYAHLKETGDDFIRDTSYKTFVRSFFSIKSSTNIKTRYWFSLKHSPIKVIYFLFDTFRIVISFHLLYLKKHLR